MDSVNSWKKISAAFFVFIFLFLNNYKKVFGTLPVYDNPGQGIFQCHANNEISADYIKGGGVVARWDHLQPTDTNQLNQTELNNLFNLIRGHKKTYLHFQIYVPNGDALDSTILPDWLYSQVATVNNGHPVPWDTVYQAKLRRFLDLLKTALTQAGLDDSIEYIEPSAGGMWATTHLWIRPRELCNWAVVAGCTTQSFCATLPDSGPDLWNTNLYCNSASNRSIWQCLGQKYTQGVNATLENYLDAFPDYPVMMIGGSCLCGGCEYTGFNGLVSKYGMRLMTKEAGLGSNTDGSCGLRPYLGNVCSYKTDMTKCGQETWGGSVFCTPGGGFDPAVGCGYKKEYNSSLRTEKISYYCLYSDDIGCNAIDTPSGEKVEDINKWVADSVGAQIVITSATLDGVTKNVGAPLTISTTWENHGSSPLVAPLKQGIKWLPSSYKLFVEFVKNGQVIDYEEFPLNPPSNQWVTMPLSTAATTSTVFNISPVLGGQTSTSQSVYQLYAGLTDPNGENKRFALRNSDANYDAQNKRYLLTNSFTVVGQATGPTNTPRPSVTPNATPTVTPAVSPTPLPTQNPSCSCQAGVPEKYLGNANCDNKIDGLDFEIWRQEVNGLRTTTRANFDCANGVNQADFNIWRQNRSH